MRDSANDYVPLNLSVELKNAYRQADAARAETEVLCKAILTLAQHLRMDFALDSLLRCVLDVVPYDLASVILTQEVESELLFVARQLPVPPAPRVFIEFKITDNPFVQHIIHVRKSIFLADTKAECAWRVTRAFSKARCWIGVPLVMGETVVGLLSIGSLLPGSFTEEHFRLAKVLAIPVSVAVHNAHLCEWAAIYEAERPELIRRAGQFQYPS
jgi:GAF domain-containing protein